VLVADERAVLRLDRAGVVCVRKCGDCLGARCNELHRQLCLLHREYGFERCFVEGFASAHARASDEVSVALRAAVRMFAAAHGVPCDVAMPQTWKAAVVDRERGGGNATKEAVAEAVERTLGAPLPSHVWVLEPGEKRRRAETPHDVSDAVGVALWGATRQAGLRVGTESA
jgi:Holliday junction resolvasome RuvABC endonuclease subunit